MVISIRAIAGKEKSAVECGALLAGMTALCKSKKTVLLQYTAGETVSALDVLKGRDLEENRIFGDGVQTYSENGLDSMRVYASSMQLGKEQFNDTVAPIMEKANLFDVLKPSTQKDFYDMVELGHLTAIIEGSKELYDYTYVILPNNENIVKKVTAICDENIVVVPHGPVTKDFIVTDDKKPVSYLISDFESSSKYDVKMVKKAYNTKKVYTVPHNYLYKDALLGKNMLGFIMRNKKDMKDDINYPFTASLNLLLNRLVAGMDDDEDEMDLPQKTKTPEPPKKELQEIPDGAAQEVVVKKGGLFKKKEKQVTINL